MAQRVPDDDPPEVIQRLDALLAEVTALRERINTAQEKDRRRQQLPFIGPDRRKRSPSSS
jgi:hypothetical protein